MKKAVKNKKALVSVVSLFSALVIMLVGTFAWRLIEEAETGGQGYSYDYLVKLMDDSTNPLIIKNNWKVGEQLEKLVYATSSYTNDTIKTNYDVMIANDPEAVFSDTWVRIQLEEVLTRNGNATSKIVKGLSEGMVVSQFSDYFKLLNSTDTQIITLLEWDGVTQGRFWILDENTGWLYWAQPVLATTPEEIFLEQTTDLIIDQVELVNKPSGTWTYTIKATLDAMDVELDGYNDEGAWNDVLESDKIYGLFSSYRRIPVAIIPRNFPDENFRQYLKIYGHDVDGDGWLNQEELDEIRTLFLSYQNIDNLVGIEYFRNLETLYAGYSNMTSIDISKNQNLKTLVLSTTNITNIDLSKNEGLEEFGIYYTNISSVDVSKNHNLKFLSIGSTQIRDIDISKNDKLLRLGLSDNQLTHIDISNNLFLEHLDASYSTLKSIDLSKNKNLTEIRLSDCEITSIDVSKQTDLQVLILNRNPLSQLDVSNNTKLNNLAVYGTSLSEINLTNNLALTFLDATSNQLTSIDLSNNTELFQVDLDDNQLTNIDFTNLSKLKYLDVSGNRLSVIDVSNNLQLTSFRYANQRPNGIDILVPTLVGWPRS